MGRPLPGVPVVLVDPVTGERVSTSEGGEICLDLTGNRGGRPVNLMTGYQQDQERRRRTGLGAEPGDGVHDPEVRPRPLAPFLRVRRLEFFELPKTISGKIRRVELRACEDEGVAPPRSSLTTGASVGSVGEEHGCRRSELLVELEDPTVAGVGVDDELTVLDAAVQVLGEG